MFAKRFKPKCFKKKRTIGGSNPSIHRVRGTWYNQKATHYHYLEAKK